MESPQAMARHGAAEADEHQGHSDLLLRTPDSQGGWEKRGENRRIVILTVINDDVNDDSNDDLNDDVNEDLNDDVNDDLNDNECNSSLSVL